MSRKFLTPIVLPADPAVAMEAATKQYVDGKAGGGTDEVWIGPTDPIATSPSIELWYDDDAVATLNSDMRWYTAWGIVGTTPPNGTVNVPAGSGQTTLTQVLNFTTVVGRRYRVTFLARATNPASAPVASNLLLFDGAVDTTALSWWAYMPAPYAGFTATTMLNGDGLAHAYTVRIGQNAGQAVNVWVDSPVSPFFIEDVGPTGGTNAAPAEADLRWFSAWGVIAIGTAQTTSVAYPGANIPITPALSFQTVAGRRYRATMRIASATFTAGTATTMAVTIRSGTSGGASLGDTDQWLHVPGSYSGAICTQFFTGDGTAKTAQGITETISASGTTVSLGVQALVIEDVGPVTGSSIIPTSVATPWTTLTYQNGWTTFDNRPASYRKVGDIVEMRGVIRAGTVGWGTAVVTLPVGFRPPTSSVAFVVNTAAGAGACDVFSDGRVSITSMPNVAIPVDSWVYIDPVRFSVTL